MSFIRGFNLTLSFGGASYCRLFNRYKKNNILNDWLNCADASKLIFNDKNFLKNVTKND